MKKIYLFSDGSSLGNPGPGGYCAIVKYKDAVKQVSGGGILTTNNQMELKGVIEGLKILKEPCDVDVTSDSKYVVQAINGWLKSWVKNNWKTAAKKPVKNIDLWKEYLEVSKSHKIIGIWVKGHNGHEENEICDTVARDEAIKFKMGNN